MPTDLHLGDLFDNTHHVQAFAHGCNCQGSMGAGVAKTFKACYPEMYDEYRRRCKAEPWQFNRGECWLWKADKQPWVFNLGIHERYWRARAGYEAIGTALRSMRKEADAEGITSIAMPRIGVGYGGLSWKKVREMSRRCSTTGTARWWSTKSTWQVIVPRPPSRPRVGPPEHPRCVWCLLLKSPGRPVYARRGLRRPVANQKEMPC